MIKNPPGHQYPSSRIAKFDGFRRLSATFKKLRARSSAVQSARLISARALVRSQPGPLTAASPASSSARLRSPKVSVREPVYLTEDECIRLLQTVTQRAKPEVRGRDLAVVILFLATGLRASELCNLKMSDVNLREKQIKAVRKGGKEQYLNLTP